MILISHQETSPWQSPLFLLGRKVRRSERSRDPQTHGPVSGTVTRWSDQPREVPAPGHHPGGSHSHPAKRGSQTCPTNGPGRPELQRKQKWLQPRRIFIVSLPPLIWQRSWDLSSSWECGVLINWRRAGKWMVLLSVFPILYYHSRLLKQWLCQRKD